MSKLTKLIKEPKLFFYDAIEKKLNIKNKKNEVNKVNISDRVKADDIDISRINPFSSYDFIYCCGESLEAGKHHLLSWLPIFFDYEKRFGIRFILIVRNRKIYNWAIKEYPWLSIAYCRRTADIEFSLKNFRDVSLALYSSAATNNGSLIRFNSIKHVFIGHGDSEKAGSAHKGMRWFDEVWTAGQAHIDRFKNTGVNFDFIEFKKIGRPALKPILLNSKDIWEPLDINVLYLPTWEGAFASHEYLSVGLSKEVIDMVCNDLKLKMSIKFHPYTGGRDPKFKSFVNLVENNAYQISNLEIVGPDINILKIIGNHNIFICDISSVVTECLGMNCPIFLYIPKDVNIEIASSNIKYEEYCYIFSDINELKEKLSSVLTGNDYLADSRKNAMDYFIGMKETCDEVMAQQIQENTKVKL